MHGWDAKARPTKIFDVISPSNSRTASKPGVIKLFTQRASFEKNLEVKGRTDGKCKKKSACSQMFCFLLKSKKTKKGVYTSPDVIFSTENRRRVEKKGLRLDSW